MAAATQTVSYTVSPTHEFARLDAFLASTLPWRSRRSLVALVDAGAVEVNGRRVKKAHRLAPGDVVALRVPMGEQPIDLATIPLTILHEDEDLVVVNKPDDLAVHPASTCLHRNLLRRLEYHYVHEKPSKDTCPSVIHRLDRTTSGVVAFVKRRELVAFYSGQFERRTTDKEYLAIVHGRPADSGTIEDPIWVVDRDVARVGPGGKPSRTDFRVVDSGPRFSKLAIVLHTGRKHQIRVHLAARGHPLVGDGLYGGLCDATEGIDRTGPLLHAACLELDHRDGRRLTFRAPPPQTMICAWRQLREHDAVER